jgi:transposase
MRQTHVGGDKLFVDYAGHTVPVIIDRPTGEVRQAQIFVAVMGASWTQTLGDWIAAHTRANGGCALACAGIRTMRLLCEEVAAKYRTYNKILVQCR